MQLIVQEPPWGKGHTSPLDLDLDNVYTKWTTVSVPGPRQAADHSQPEGLHQRQVGKWLRFQFQQSGKYQWKKEISEPNKKKLRKKRNF